VYTAPSEGWSYGCVIARMAIDRDTGQPRIERLVWVDDAGRIISPQLAEGQLLGGLAQGLGQAMLERIVYDGEGQLLTGSLMDYAVPRADDMPPVELESLAITTQANLLGAKGVGEAGCIGVPAALLNAAADALSPWASAIWISPSRPNASGGPCKLPDLFLKSQP
jgi:carbon-monoxide dehydrogenase large subunit